MRSNDDSIGFWLNFSLGFGAIFGSIMLFVVLASLLMVPATAPPKPQVHSVPARLSGEDLVDYFTRLAGDTTLPAEVRLIYGQAACAVEAARIDQQQGRRP